MKFLQASAVLAAIAIPSVTAVSRASLQGKASPKVAIVDATYISTASKWAKVNYLDKIDKESRGYESQLQKIGLDIERLKRDQVWLKAKSHKWNLKQVEVETLGHRRQLLGRTYRLWLDSEMNSASRAIYERIANAVKLVCEKQGIDLVLKKRGTRNSSNPNIKDAVRLDQIGHVLARHRRHDQVQTPLQLGLPHHSDDFYLTFDLLDGGEVGDHDFGGRLGERRPPRREDDEQQQDQNRGESQDEVAHAGASYSKGSCTDTVIVASASPPAHLQTSPARPPVPRLTGETPADVIRPRRGERVW